MKLFLEKKVQALFAATAWPPWLQAVAFGLAYFASAMLSRPVTGTHEYLLNSWLPSGLFLGVLLLTERRHWWWLVLAGGLGDLAYNYLVEWTWTLKFLLLAHLGNSASAVLGAWLMRRLVAERPTLDSMREFFGLLVFGGLLSLPLSATIGTLLIKAGTPGIDWWLTWGLWYCSDLLGVLLLTPVLLAWQDGIRRPALWHLTPRFAEVVALWLGAGVTLSLSYYFQWPKLILALFLAIPYVIWATFRFGLRGVSPLVFFCVLLAQWFIHRDYGIIGSSTLPAAAKNLELLVGFGGFILLSLFPAVMLAAQHRTEAALREKDRVYRDLIENINQGYYVADRRSRFTYCNPAFYAMGEYSRDDLAGISCFRLVAEEDRARVIQAYRQWARDPAMTEVRCEFRAATKSGRRFWVEQATHFLRDHDGQVIEGRNVLRDITERRHAESRQRELVGYLNKARDGILVTDLDNRILYWNQGAERITGWSAAEIIGRALEEIPGSLSPAQFQAMRQAIQETGAWQGATQLTSKQGQRVDVAISITLVHDEAGQPKARLSILTDITARQQAEEALALERGKLAAAFENTGMGLVLSDAQGGNMIMNAAALKFYGYATTAEMHARVGDGAAEWELRYPDGRPMPFAEWPLLRALRGDFVQDYQARLRHRQTGHAWVGNYTAVPVRNAAGEVTLIVMTILDITAHKTAEARLREQAGLLNKTQDIIIVTDLDNRFTFWNKATEHLTGWSAAEALGQTAELVFGPGTRDRLETIREAELATGAWQGEFPLNHKDGRSVILDLRVTLIRDAAGQPSGRISIGTDITEKKQIAEQFLRAQRMESIGMLASGIAHDLNNVLAPILMSAPLLRHHLSAPGDLRILEILEKSAERGAALVRQILGFVQGVAGGVRPTQVKHLVRDIVELAHETFPKSIAIESNLPGDLWLVQANPSQIHQVLLNLCVNARDAMPDGGTLTLAARNLRAAAGEAHLPATLNPGAYVVLSVGDTGTGILPEFLEKIWDPFFTTKAPNKGTGLGLSTTRSIIGGLGGVITLDTAVGRGTTFTVFLPALESDPARDSDQPFAIAPTGNNELILVVDDEAHIRDVASATLVQFGYRVLTASDGIEAVQLYAAHATDIALVITDLNMPNLDGLGFALVARQIKPSVKIIVSSGLSSSHHVSEARRRGDGFIQKPFPVEELLEQVYRILHPKHNG